MDKKAKTMYRDYVVMIRFQHLQKSLEDNRALDEIRFDNSNQVSFENAKVYVEKSFVNSFRIKEDERLEERKIIAIKRSIAMFRNHFATGVLAPQLFIENESVPNYLQQLLKV